MGLFLFLLRSLGKVLGDQLGHFKHADLSLTAKNFFQVFIGIYIALILLILQAVLFDVDPKFFNDFGAGHRALTNHRGEFATYGHWFHESRICHELFCVFVWFLDFGGIIPN